jgi:DNA polymerase-3 subunit delta
MPTVSVHNYLDNPAQYPAKGVSVISGDDFLSEQAEQVLRQKLLGGEDGEFSLTQFEGNKDLKFTDVFSAAASKSMFGKSSRVVLINDADAFVSANRSLLEDYAAKPSSSSIVVILLKTFPSNTKLYKATADTGLIIEANALSDKEMPNWVVKRAKQRYKIVCDASAAGLMVQMVGVSHGLLDQELAKLSVLVKDKEKITPELVEQNSGSWSVKKIFDVLDAALLGNTAETVSQLNKLLAAGEQPIAMFGAVSSSLRRFAAATQVILNADKN